MVPLLCRYCVEMAAKCRRYTGIYIFKYYLLMNDIMFVIFDAKMLMQTYFWRNIYVLAIYSRIWRICIWWGYETAKIFY